jgi:hypothetical protein
MVIQFSLFFVYMIGLANVPNRYIYIYICQVEKDTQEIQFLYLYIETKKVTILLFLKI